MLVDPFEPLRHVHVAVEIDIAVGRMIVTPVEVQIGLVGQIRDAGRVPAGFIRVGRVRVERSVDLPAEDILRGGERAFHLIVNDAVHSDLTIGIPGLIMPALLAENVLFLINIRIKNSVQVDVHQVLEILVVAARHGIDGLVRISHGIEEGIQRPLRKFNEGILDGKLPGTAQDGVLYDVRDTGGILRRRAEGDIKDLVAVVFGKQGDPRPCLFVPEKPAVAVHIRQSPVGDHLIGRQAGYFLFLILFYHKILILLLNGTSSQSTSPQSTPS